MMDRWAKQTENLAAYTENLKKAAQYGLDDGLVASLSDGSTESAGYLATIISKIEQLGGTTESMGGEASAFVDQFNAAFARTEEAKESFANTVAAIQTNLDEGIAGLEQSASDVDFSGFSTALENAFADVGVDFETIGVECGNGLAQGISGSSGTVSGAASDMADEAVSATKGTLGVNSPSTVFRDIGENCDEGMDQGIRNKIPVVISAVNQMGQQMNTKMQQCAKQTVDTFDREFSQIVGRTSSTCSAIVSAASGAASGLPGAMYSIGVQSIDGMINGLNSRSGALYSTISSIVSNAIANIMRIAFEYFIYTYGPTLALTILAAIFGTLGHAAKRLYTRYINTKEKEAVAYTVAAFVEQVWKDLHGYDKMAKALETASALLKKKNIDYDAAEMRVLIEAAVAEFNGAFQQPLTDEASAGATRRVENIEDRQESGLLDE